MGKESIFKTLTVAIAVSAVCAVLVSLTATVLKEQQGINSKLDKKRNILLAAGVIDSKGNLTRNDEDAPKVKANIEEEFTKLVPQVIDLETGNVVEGLTPQEIDNLDPSDMVKNPETRIALTAKTDLPKIKFIPRQAVVYILKDESGEPLRYIFPVYGKGLWSTMYGFIALESDLNTVSNITFYAHGETPGLGGEIVNPKWQARWIDKKVFDPTGKPVLKVNKGHVNPDTPSALFEVDGISGSTLTCNGVTNAVQFWLGENGFGPYLKKLKN